MPPRLQGLVMFLCLGEMSLRVTLFFLFRRHYEGVAWALLVMIALSLCYAATWAPTFAKYTTVFGIVGVLTLSLLTCGIHHLREQARRQACTNYLRQGGLTVKEQRVLDPQLDEQKAISAFLHSP